MKRRTFCASALWPLALLASRHVSAIGDYPNRTIRLIEPFNAGGTSDIVLRPLIAKVGAALGQSIIIEYRPGGSTIIGTQLLAKAKPDGYTLGFIADTHVLNPLINKSLPYDSFADFAPVTQLVDAPFALVTSSSLPVKTLPELIKYAKANPGKLSYASTGMGTPQHLGMEWFKHLAGVDLVHVPFSGSAPGLTAVVGGHVQLLFTALGLAMRYINNEKVNVMAVTSSKRQPIVPQIPTIAESGYPDFALSFWFGILAPARTPPEIVAKLSQEMGNALRSSDLRETLLAQALIPAPSTPEEFTAMLHRSSAFYERLVKTTNVKLTD